jgi:site-specific DNA recombinase
MDEGTTSPQRQRQAIRKWCKTHGAQLVETFEDLDLSAYRKGVRRPGFDRMMSRLGDVDVVVTWRLDRLARSVSAFSKMLDAFEDAGVKVATTDGQVDTTTAAGRAMVQMTAVFAELEAGTTSERARQMHAYKRERGEWVGRVPFGWRRNGKGLEKHPEEFRLLELAARRYVAGESLRRIAADVGMHHPNLARMFRSDRFIDAVPPALSVALVEQLAERGRTGTRAKRSLLGGIARCGLCGAGMTVVADRGGWAAYSCRERSHVSISKPWLDDHVAANVLDAIDRGKLIERLERRRKRRPGTPVATEIEARLELLERDFYERGMLSRDRYLRRREGLIRRLDEARKSAEPDGLDLPRELAEHLAERWEDLTVFERRRILVAVVEGVDIDKAKSHGPIDPSRVRIVWRS